MLAPLLRHSGQTFPEPTDLGEPLAVQGSVGELPRVRIGAVYRNGRRVRSFTGDLHYFPHIFLPHRNAQRQRLWMGDGHGEFLIDYRQFAPLYDYTSSWVIDVPDARTGAREVHRLIFPWFTVARFFFAGSSALLNLLFMSALIDGAPVAGEFLTRRCLGGYLTSLDTMGSASKNGWWTRTRASSPTLRRTQNFAERRWN